MVARIWEGSDGRGNGDVLWWCLGRDVGRDWWLPCHDRKSRWPQPTQPHFYTVIGNIDVNILALFNPTIIDISELYSGMVDSSWICMVLGTDHSWPHTCQHKLCIPTQTNYWNLSTKRNHSQVSHHFSNTSECHNDTEPWTWRQDFPRFGGFGITLIYIKVRTQSPVAPQRQTWQHPVYMRYLVLIHQLENKPLFNYGNDERN